MRRRPAITVPTASNPEVLGSDKLSIGPTGVIFYGIKKWTMGAVGSNIWSVAGDSSREDVNFFFAQWFVNYNLGKGWALGTAPIITCDWEAASGEECTIPWGLQISKVTHIGHQPVNVLGGYYKNSEHRRAAPTARSVSSSTSCSRRKSRGETITITNQPTRRRCRGSLLSPGKKPDQHETRACFR
jgi:hypothetical protein